MPKRLTKQQRLEKLLAEVAKVKQTLQEDERKARQRRNDQLAKILQAAGLLEWFLELDLDTARRIRELPTIGERLRALQDRATGQVTLDAQHPALTVPAAQAGSVRTAPSAQSGFFTSEARSHDR